MTRVHPIPAAFILLPFLAVALLLGGATMTKARADEPAKGRGRHDQAQLNFISNAPSIRPTAATAKSDCALCHGENYHPAVRLTTSAKLDCGVCHVTNYHEAITTPWRQSQRNPALNPQNAGKEMATLQTQLKESEENLASVKATMAQLQTENYLLRARLQMLQRVEIGENQVPPKK